MTARRFQADVPAVPPRILLLLPSTTYQAGAFLAAAGRLGALVTVGTDHGSVFDGEQPANLLSLDFKSPADVTRRVVAFALEHPIAAVMGVDDLTAVLAADVARALGLVHADPAACEAARDKHRQRVLLEAAGQQVPAFELVRFDEDHARRARDLPYPCVVKPLTLSMSRGVMRVDTPAAYPMAVERLRRIVLAAGATADAFLVERFVAGPEFAVEALLLDGQLETLAVFQKPDPLDGPYFAETIYATPCALGHAEEQRVVDCVRGAAHAIGLTRGPVHAEVRLNKDGAWLVELAARPIGGKCAAVLRFGRAGEESLEQLLLRAALGRWERDSAGAITREPGGVAVYMIPVPRAGTLRAVHGLEAARSVGDVDDIVITAHVGQALQPLPEGNRYLGFIFARAAFAEDAIAAVRQAHAKLVFELA